MSEEEVHHMILVEFAHIEMPRHPLLTIDEYRVTCEECIRCLNSQLPI